MPFLDEDTAFSITQNFDQLDDIQKAKATAALQTYKATQTELGLPLFPRREREKKQTTEKINSSLRDGPDSITTHFPEYEPTFKSSPDPAGDKQTTAAMLFLADRTGLPLADIYQKLPTVMQQYSQQVWGESVTDTSTFFAKAQKQVKDEDTVRDISGEAFKLALDDAVSGKTDGVAAYAKWKTMAQGTGMFQGDQQAGDFAKVYNITAAKLKPHLPLVQEVTRLLEAGMTGKPISTTSMPDQSMDPQVFAANKLMDLPPDERDLVIAAIMSKTGQVGEQAEKGDKYGLNPVQVIPQTGEAFARTLTDMYGANELNIIQSAREGFAKSETFTTMERAVTTPEEARAFIKEQLVNKGIEALSAMDGYSPKLGTARKLTAEESALVSKELARAERSARAVAQMSEAARSADPVKNLFASTIGSSLATLPVAMVPGGLALSAVGYANAEDKQLALEHPEMSSGDRAAIVGVSGLVMGAIDKLNVSFLADKLPSLRNLISKGVSNSVLKRAGVRMAETTAFENIAEGAQDITTAVVQDIASKLSNDVPDVDWTEQWTEWSAGRADVAIGLLPLTLFGVGVATAKDINGAKTMLSNNKMLEQAGVLEKDRTVIVELAAANKLEESQAALREAWTRRSKEVATAALPPEQVQAQADATKRFNALEQAGVAPTFTKTQNGWAVRAPDGNEVQAESWAEAQQIAGQHMADTINRDIDDSAKLADFFVSQQREGMNESVLIDPAEQGGTLAEDTSITEEQAMDRAKVGAILAGMTPEEAARETQFILGKNVIEFQGGVAESASKLFQGANVTTVVEEVVEGRIKAGLQLNRYTPAGLRKMVDMAEQATGEKFLASDTEQGLLEAVSALVVADVLSVRKDGSKLPAGVVTRGMMTAVEGVAEKKEGKRLMAMMHAFRTFFRQVFSRAKALRKAKAEGKLGADYQSFMDELLGIDPAIRENNAVANEAMQLTGVQVAAPTTSFATAPAKFMDAVQKKRDAAYLAAVEAGDLATAQRMVDEAATIEKHGQRVGAIINEFLSVLREGDPLTSEGDSYGFEIITDEVESDELSITWIENQTAPKGTVAKVLTGLADFYNVKLTPLGGSQAEYYESLGFVKKGKDMVLAKSTKSADPINRDESGNVIPLSQRFNPESDSISYAVAPAKFMDAVQKKLDEELGNKPYQRVSFYEEVKKRFAKVADDTNKLVAAANAAKDRAALSKEMQQRSDQRLAELVAEQGGKVSVDERITLQAQAQKEAQAWMDAELKKVEKSNPTDLAKVQGFIRTLNAGLMGLPPKMRGKIGGMLALSKSTTPAAALKVIEARLEKMGEVVEAELQKEYREQIKDTIKAGRVKGGAGDKPKSDTGAEVSSLFELVAQAVEWDNSGAKLTRENGVVVFDPGKLKAEVAWRERVLSNIDDITSGNLTDKEREAKTAEVEAQAGGVSFEELEQLLTEEIVLIELVGDIANADSNRLAAISETLDIMLREGKMGERIKANIWRAQIDDLKQQLTTATGITDIEAARAAMLKDTASLGTFAKNVLLNVSSLSELMTYLFGSAAKQFIDMERKADYALHDLNHNMESRVEKFFNQLAGGDMAAQKLRYKMAEDRDVTVGKEVLTQNEAIHFLMTWRQPLGRKHMEGKVTSGVEKARLSSWAYTQADADAVQAQLTPEGQALMDFLTGEYAAEFDVVDGLYQERYGAKLPRNPFYSPMSVAPNRVSLDESTDPQTGSQVSEVSIVPNSLRTRSTSAVNRPNFNDALQMYLHHGREINHWVATYDFVKTMRAVFGNREMMDLVEAKGGKEAGKQLRLRIKIAVQGGVTEVVNSMTLAKWLGGTLGRVASAAILGRVSTLMIQTTQVAAASMKMPAGAFLHYQAKLMSGQLDWGAAFNSDFIQRRIQQKSPLVRAAVQDLSMAKKPGHIKASAQILGNLLSNTDGFMTAATYNVLYHFHLDQARAEGIADPEAYAANEAERITEEVAQPVRQANRSTFELASNNPLAKVGMAFISESRQKLALALWAAKNAKADPAHAAKVAFYTFVVNGLYVQALKGWWNITRGREDDEVWDWKKILIEVSLSPITGMPGYQAFVGSTGLLEAAKNALPAIGRLVSGDSADDERVMRDVEAVLMGAALVSESFSALAGWSHLLGDSVRVLDYLEKKLDE